MISCSETPVQKELARVGYAPTETRDRYQGVAGENVVRCAKAVFLVNTRFKMA